MKTVSLWKKKGMQAPNILTTWLGTLAATMEMDFPPSGVFVTLGVPSCRLVHWLEVDATGPISGQHLADGCIVIAVGNRIDADLLRSKFAADLDFSVVSTSGGPERVRDFMKNIDRVKA